MSNRRRALLLAIAEYDSAPHIPYVCGDIPRMRRCLAMMGVPDANVEAHGAGTADEAFLSSNRIRALTQSFLEGLGEEDDALIYYSGHGIEQEGHRLLIPQDYDIMRPSQPFELVSDIDLHTWARRSAAKSVVFLVDACREGMRLTIAPDPMVTKSAAVRAGLELHESKETPTVAMVFGCSVGEQSGAERDKGECSAFTRAIAEELEAEDEGGQLCQVLRNAQIRLDAVRQLKQTIALSDQRSFGRRGAPETLTVKHNPATQFRSRLDNSRWVAELRELPLWRRLSENSPALATQVSAIVVRAEASVEQAAQALACQRWRVADAPFRVLQRIQEQLIDEDSLSLAEAAAILCVPFVYEVVLASAEGRLAKLGALFDGSVLSDVAASPLVRAWRTALLSDDQGRRHRERLAARGNAVAAADYACWQLNSFCHGAGELWDPVGAEDGCSGWAVQDVVNLVELAPLREVRSDLRISNILTARRVLRLARLMFAAYEDVDLSAGDRLDDALDRDVRFGQGEAELRMDEVRVAHLVNIGARLALDARRLSEILAEHLGVDEEFSLGEVQAALSRAEWHLRDRVLSLGLACPHEALDAALRQATHDLERYKSSLVAGVGLGVEFVERLPLTVNSADLHAKLRHGRARYNTDHLRFSLDERRVMSLLMGKELYAKPEMAIRELYQNALDACRYRRAHESYIEKRKNVGASVAAYMPKISLTFAADASGRKYIECLDNGIGMAHRHMRRLFARAGQRFTDSHEYHLDKARWETLEVPFFPNSRFGIGVLSYFMLAEEIEVESQRVGMPEVPRPAPVHARVLGSGSLFRLDGDLSGAVYLGGTRVRLYLEDQAVSLLSYYESVLGWLFMPEVETVLSVEGDLAIELQPGKPSARCEQRLGPLLPMPGSEGPDSAHRVFWCVGAAEKVGGILVDGIKTVELETYFRRQSDVQPWRTLINLTGELAPELSVDRTRILAFDEGAAFARRAVALEGGRTLAAWGEPKLDILLDIARGSPLAFVQLSNGLRSGELRMADVDIQAPEGIKLPTSAGLTDLDDYITGYLGTKRVLRASAVSCVGSKLLSIRLGELIGAGVAMPSCARLLAGYFNPERKFQVPPISVTLVSRVHQYDFRGLWSHFETITKLDLVFIQYLLKIQAPEMEELLRPLRAIGIPIPELSLSGSGYGLSERQLRLLSREFDERSLSRRDLSALEIVWSARRTGSSVEETYKLAEAMRSWGVGVPEWEAVCAVAHVPELLRKIDIEFPVDDVGVADCLNALHVKNISMDELKGCFGELRQAGVSVLSDEQLQRIFALSRTALNMLSFDFHGSPPFKGRITGGHILGAFRQAEESPEQFRANLKCLEEAGVDLPKADWALLDDGVSQEILLALSRDGDARSPWSAELELRELARRAEEQNLSVGELVRRLTPFSGLFPELHRMQSLVDTSTPRVDALLRRLFEGSVGSSLSCWDLAGAAEELEVPISSFGPELIALSDLGVNISSCEPFLEWCRMRE